ncbi:MAG: hypothetical protein K9N46_09430 [Candidatus Marinimicrobia bacterium]|nr:hypothetical protein [Candidatus Neomarinimicrobiota bacterium]MCF7828461.1 hypothetical protein [Candidatus Neomarinimicrobiota bacterium]MCF7880945.1 hypothetical protein [Candidatus Neomarinimicrobiota bacterium]
MSRKTVIALLTCIMIVFSTGLRAADDVPVKDVIDTIKNFNFITLRLGIISTGVSEETIEELTALQSALPRSMEIFITQSKYIGDMFEDFTFLVNRKQVDAVLIWPSKGTKNVTLIKKVCKMSKMKKVPVITLYEPWLNEGAAAFIQASPDGIKVIENSVITNAMKFPIAEKPLYAIEQR